MTFLSGVHSSYRCHHKPCTNTEGACPIRLGDDTGPCLTSAGESSPVGLAACTGDPSQRWSLGGSTSIGTNGTNSSTRLADVHHSRVDGAAGAGHISSAGPPGCKWKWGADDCCLDDWNGAGQPGDAIYTYSCWSGTNQAWVVVDTP
jgi:hypothetical protein